MAYRKDVEGRKGPIGPDDGSWIVISTIAGHIVHAKGKDRRRFLDDAAKMAAELFTPEALAYGCTFDPPAVDRASSIAILRLLSERMEYAGSVNLATCLLDALAAVLPVDSLNSGRVLSQRARISLKAAKIDLALARFEHLRRKARKLESNELLVRAWVGRIGVAQVRGNQPEVRRLAGLVVDVSRRCGFERLEASGHHALAMVHSNRGETQDAIPHAWAAYRGRSGDARAQLEMLGNLGRLFLDAGQPSVARAAFVRVLAGTPPLNIGALALGGYALTSAMSGDRRAVNWAAAEASSLSNGSAMGYESATALLDCAIALDLIGDAPYASVLRARGSTIAQYAGYHELVFKADGEPARAVRPTQPPLTGRPTEIAREIDQLPEAVLPDHLELIPA
jgi:hypothetical protein